MSSRCRTPQIRTLISVFIEQLTVALTESRVLMLMYLFFYLSHTLSRSFSCMCMSPFFCSSFLLYLFFLISILSKENNTDGSSLNDLAQYILQFLFKCAHAFFRKFISALIQLIRCIWELSLNCSPRESQQRNI